MAKKKRYGKVRMDLGEVSCRKERRMELVRNRVGVEAV